MRIPPCLFLLLAVPWGSAWAAGTLKTEPYKVELTIKNEAISRISPRLFGQFLERAFGEPGPEAALVEGTNQLRPDIVAKLKQMRIPLIRFPGGTSIDYLDWRDMIDHVPGREEGRPPSIDILGKTGKTITNQFGYDEYFE